MGSVLSCRSGMSFHASARAEASVETIVEIWTHVENRPEVISWHIRSVEVLEHGDPEKNYVGAKWKEVRVYENKPLVVINTITNVTEQPYYCATYNACYVGNTWQSSAANQTGTFSVLPMNDNTSQILFTTNFVSEGLYGFCMKFCGVCIRRNAVKHMTEEIEEFAAFAARKEQGKLTGSA